MLLALFFLLFSSFNCKRAVLNSVRFFSTQDRVNGTSSSVSIVKLMIDYFVSLPSIFKQIQPLQRLCSRSVILVYPALKHDDLEIFYASKVLKSYESHGVKSHFIHFSRNEFLVYLTLSKKLDVKNTKFFNIDLISPLAVYTVPSPIRGKDRFLECLRVNSSLVDPLKIFCSTDFSELLESRGIIDLSSFQSLDLGSTSALEENVKLSQPGCDVATPEPVNFDITSGKNWIACHCSRILCKNQESVDTIRSMLRRTVFSISDESLSYKLVVHLTGFNKESQIIFAQSSILKGVYDKKTLCDSEQLYLDVKLKFWCIICDNKLSRWSFGLRVEECNQFFKDK